MFKKSPSLHARLASAAALRASAVDAFEQIAADLDSAAATAQDVAAEARAEAASLIALAGSADAHAERSGKAATNLRALVG